MIWLGYRKGSDEGVLSPVVRGFHHTFTGRSIICLSTCIHVDVLKIYLSGFHRTFHDMKNGRYYHKHLVSSHAYYAFFASIKDFESHNGTGLEARQLQTFPMPPHYNRIPMNS